MKRDPVERLAFSVARHLRTALDHPATANEHACGYGTVCMTGHPIIASLWLQCVKGKPERALIEAERDSASMTPIREEQERYDPRSEVPRLPMILYHDGDTTISLMTRIWVLDELRWLSLSQREPGDSPRTRLDTILSQLNHGNPAVAIHLVDLVLLLKKVIK